MCEYVRGLYMFVGERASERMCVSGRHGEGGEVSISVCVIACTILVYLPVCANIRMYI